MQSSSGGFFSIQFFSTEAAGFVMPILFPDYCEYTWYPCASHTFLMSCVVFMRLPCCFTEGKKPPEDDCMEPKHVVEEEQEI
jgi:hypothetical protein